MKKKIKVTKIIFFLTIITMITLGCTTEIKNNNQNTNLQDTTQNNNQNPSENNLNTQKDANIESWCKREKYETMAGYSSSYWEFKGIETFNGVKTCHAVMMPANQDYYHTTSDGQNGWVVWDLGEQILNFKLNNGEMEEI
ncbi:MAG: hypothetical protein ACOC1P_00670 [Minisyncoccales bacterium]